jgi:hypothetical protein
MTRGEAIERFGCKMAVERYGPAEYMIHRMLRIK